MAKPSSSQCPAYHKSFHCQILHVRTNNLYQLPGNWWVEWILGRAFLLRHWCLFQFHGQQLDKARKPSMAIPSLKVVCKLIKLYQQRQIWRFFVPQKRKRCQTCRRSKAQELRRNLREKGSVVEEKVEKVVFLPFWKERVARQAAPPNIMEKQSVHRRPHRSIVGQRKK